MIRSRRLRPLILLVVPVLLSATTATATDWHVPGDAATVAAGLELAQPGDSVILAGGTYREHDLLMKSGVILRGETGRGGDVVIDAKGLGRVLLCEGTAAGTELAGITFTGGLLTENRIGGGVLVREGELDITDCIFQGNEVEYNGGGLAGDHAVCRIRRCVFEYNLAGVGGAGIYLKTTGGEMNACRIRYNESMDGAGLFLEYESSPTITYCIIRNNIGRFFGGGIFCQIDSSPMVSNCTVAGNKALSGAGILTAGDAYPTLIYSVVAFNLDGAGVRCVQDSYIDMACCDVFANDDGGYSGLIDDQTGLNGNIARDPAFCDLAAGDLTLTSNSPCLPANNGCGQLMGAEVQGCSASPVPDIAAGTIRLLQNHPNPFNPATNIGFELTAAGPAELAIYTLDGHLVRRLVSGTLGEGHHEYIWRGRDERDRAVPSGVYLYRLKSGTQTVGKRLTLLR